MWKPLFISGCPRSGTSAFQKVFSNDERIFLGMERYYFRGSGDFSLTPECFEKDRFYRLSEGDTFWSNLNNYNGSEDRFEKSIFRGDKIPKLYKHFDELKLALPLCKTLFIYRNIFDVAASYNSRARNLEDQQWARSQDYKVAISDWNESLRNCLNALNKGCDILPVSYESFFSDIESIQEIYDFLGISINSNIIQRFGVLVDEYSRLQVSKKDKLSAQEKNTILLHADIEAFKFLKTIQVKK